MSLINLLSLGTTSLETSSAESTPVGTISLDLNKEFSNLLNQLRDAKRLNHSDLEYAESDDSEFELGPGVSERDALVELAAFVETAEKQLQISRSENKELKSFQGNIVGNKLSLTDLQKFVESEIGRKSSHKQEEGGEGPNPPLVSLAEGDLIEFQVALDSFISAVYVNTSLFYSYVVCDVFFFYL